MVGFMMQPSKQLKIQFFLLQLRKLWEELKDQDTPTIDLPPSPKSPAVPKVAETELGCTDKKKFTEILAAGNAAAVDDFKELATRLKEAYNNRGINMEEV
jgi:hypothetical protein